MPKAHLNKQEREGKIPSRYHCLSQPQERRSAGLRGWQADLTPWQAGRDTSLYPGRGSRKGLGVVRSPMFF